MTSNEFIKNLTREEVIDIIVEDRLTDWVYARNYDGLEEMLIVCGWEPLDGNTDEELKEVIEEYDKEQIEDYLASSKERNKKNAERRHQENKRVEEEVTH